MKPFIAGVIVGSLFLISVCCLGIQHELAGIHADLHDIAYTLDREQRQ